MKITIKYFSVLFLMLFLASIITSCSNTSEFNEIESRLDGLENKLNEANVLQEKILEENEALKIEIEEITNQIYQKQENNIEENITEENVEEQKLKEGKFSIAEDIIDLKIKKSLNSPAPENYLIVEENTCYLQHLAGGFEVIGLQNDNLEIIGRYNYLINGGEIPFKKDSLLFIPSGSDIQVIDVENKKNPELLLNIEKPEEKYFISSVYAEDDLVYFSSGYDPDIDGLFQIVDIEDKNSPTVKGQCNIRNGKVIIKEDDFIFTTAHEENALQIIDISDIENPEKISNCEIEGSFVVGMQKKEDYLYLLYLKIEYSYDAEVKGGIAIMDISDKENPKLIYDYTSIELGGGFYSENDYFFVGDKEGLKIIDFTNIEDPIIIAKCDDVRRVTGIDIEGSSLYCADERGLHMINIDSIIE